MAGRAAAVPENIEILGNPNSTPEERLRLGYTNSSQVPPHRVTWNGIWELPFGRGKKIGGNSNWATNAVIGGWQIAFIGSWNGGYWMGVPSTEFISKNPTLSSDQRLTMNIFGRKQEALVRRRLRSHGRNQCGCSEVDGAGAGGSRTAGNPSDRSEFR